MERRERWVTVASFKFANVHPTRGPLRIPEAGGHPGRPPEACISVIKCGDTTSGDTCQGGKILLAEGNRQEYVRRVNRVIDHIGARLGEELTLSALAHVAAFSPFHFHRVFRAVTGETLFAFIQRLRLERSAGVLAAASDRSVLEVALDHGFASAATFARAFKAHFCMSATAWRWGGAARWSERRRLDRKLGKQRRKRGKQLRKAGNARARRASHTDSRKGDAM